MINESKNLGIDYIIVYKLDRFARNRYDSAIYKAKLKQNGIRLLSAMEKITDSLEGIIMEGLLEAMNEYYSAEFSQKIFEIYSQGLTYANIITELNSLGYKTRRGNAFNKNSISLILSNERYIGKYTIDGIDEVSECPRIVSDKLFNKVQERLSESQKKRRHRNNHTYMLSGVLHCGDCGERMTGTSGKSKTGKHYYYYHCPNKRHGRINANNLEAAVISAIDEYLQADKVKSIAKIAFKEYQNQMLNNSELNLVKKELKSVDNKLKNAVNAILNGIQSETIKNTIEELESQKNALSVKLEELNQRSPALTLEMFENALKCLTDIPTASMIDCIIKRIDLFSDYIFVYFRLFDIDGEPPEAVKISFNVSSPPPNQTLYAKGYIMIMLPLKMKNTIL